MGLSTSEIILMYLCPALGALLSKVAYAAPLRDCYNVVVAGKGLQSLNPAPWSFMIGSSIGAITYGILKQNLFIFFGNAPGFLMAIWLNLQAVKLQYESFRSQEMCNSIGAALEGAGESTSSTATNKIHPLADAAQIVREAKETAQSMIALPPAPQETLVMANILVWLSIIAIISYSSSAVLSDPSKEMIVGVTFVLNTAIFFGSPLLTIRSVLRARNTATIHVPTMLTQTLKGSFWAAYGIAVLDPFIVVPNCIGVSFGVVQMVLCLVYPRSTTPSEPVTKALPPIPPPVRRDSIMTTTSSMDEEEDADSLSSSSLYYDEEEAQPEPIQDVSCSTIASAAAVIY